MSFVVVAQDGQYVPKILSINHLDGTPYNPSQPEAQVILSLPADVKKTVVEVAEKLGTNYKSSDFIFDDLFFFKSQLTRGPNKN